MSFFGVDIGGTFTKIGASEQGQIRSFATPKTRSELIGKIVEQIRSFDLPIDGVGLAVPGAVIGGVCGYAPNLDIIVPFDGHEVAEALNAPVAVINDGDAAAYGESKAGSFDDMVLLTLGTGVGGGVVLGGKLYFGQGGAFEIGHMVIDAFGRKCGCGMRGCFEAYASASALVDSYNRRTGKSLSGAKEVFALSDGGDEAAVAAVEEFIDYLAIGVINLCNIFRPEAIIIGGGVSQRDDLIGGVKRRCEQANFGYKNLPVPLILKARDNAGVIGAVEFIKNKVLGEE